MNKPTEPVRITVGRYAPPLWEYDGKLYEYWEASARYERDRADWLESDRSSKP